MKEETLLDIRFVGSCTDLSLCLAFPGQPNLSPFFLFLFNTGGGLGRANSEWVK